MTRAEAEQIVHRVPSPKHDNMYGRGPHAHMDIEDDFTKERSRLKTRDGHEYKSSGKPVLWAYPATAEFDYENQNRRGKPKTGRRKSPRNDPGPHRIITDGKKNIQRMVTHPRQPERLPRVYDPTRSSDMRDENQPTHSMQLWRVRDGYR
ncbi:hypothetical protein N7540_004787 [Penicillium herquei]|nr:hypothetical protein N7540_004787 [Penicillium herquei]